MGMAFQSISGYNAPPLFQTLISEGVVTSPVFGFKFATSGSELFLGGTNSALHTDDFTWVPLTNEVRGDRNALIPCNHTDIPAVYTRVTGKRPLIASL
jgi:Eukaryotic aspartyl protease